MNYGIYTRKSYYSDTSESTKMQFDACRDYLDRCPDQIGTVTRYEDDGFIRSEMDRPGMNQLKADVADALIDCVVIYRIDRVCSDMMDFCAFYTFLKEHGIKFITVKDGIDTTTPIGEAMMYLAVIFSNIEISNDTIRITDNMNHLAASGFWCGGRAPLGYDIIQVNVGARKTHKTLVRNESQIAYKNRLIEIFLDNHFSLQSMETYCRKNAIMSPTGTFLSTTQMYQIFTSPHCVEDTPAMFDYFQGLGCQIDDGSPREKWDGTHGIIVYGRTEERRVNRKKRHVHAPASQWRVSIGYHEPYMSADLFFRILGQFTRNSFDKTAKYDVPLLKGVLRCKCGRLMSMARKKKVDGSVSTWYYCPRRMRLGVDACDMPQTKSTLLDDRVLEIFAQIEKDPAVIQKYLAGGEKKSIGSSEKIRKQLAVCSEKIERLTEALSENGQSSAAKYIVSQIEKLDIDQEKLRHDLMELSAKDRREAADLKSAQEKRTEIAKLIDDFDQFTAAEKNEIAKSVLKSCTWDGETLKLVL